MDNKLSGKIALVTGGAKRIGRAVCLSLASEGVNIIIHYRKSESEARDLKIELDKFSVKSWLLKADFKNQDEYENIIDLAVEKSGGIDFLINSASTFNESTVWNLTREGFIEDLIINAWVPFSLSRSFTEKIKKGCIINLLDTRIKGFDFKHTGYIISKQVLESFTRVMALEFAPEIRVNGIAPGLILPPQKEGEPFMDELAASIPLKKHGNLNNITDSVIFLLKNDFISGQVIYVDGGKSLKE